MLFIFALPVMQVILFCLAIGRDPTGLKLAVANMEMNGTVSLFLFFSATICYFSLGVSHESFALIHFF